MTGDTSSSSTDDQLASKRTTSETIPAASRGRPRSTSISSGSPNPAPGVPLPTLFPEVAPAPPQLSHVSNTNPFPFSFPSHSSSVTGTASTSLASNLGQHQYGKSMSNNGGGGGGGHKSSLSVPGIVSPSPLVPGAVPRGGRHRRTQSVSPPGFPTMSQYGENGFSSPEQVETRRSSEPSIAVSKAEGSSLGISATSSSPRQPRLNISTSIGTRLGHQRSPSSPTRSPRSKALFSTSPTNTPAFEQPTHPPPQSHSHVHLSHHPHVHSAQHHPPISSHAALLQGVRSHALPHSPTLDASTSHHHDVSPLSTSPSMPHHSSFSARRLSGGQHSSGRPFISTSLSASTSFGSPSSPSATLSSPPFGPTASSPNGRLSPVPLELSRSGSLRQFASDQEMADAVSDSFATSPPTRAHGFHGRRRSSGSSYSPPLLPLPFDVHPPASPSAPTRSRSNSIGRAVSSSTSPASLFLEEDQTASSPNGLSSPREICQDEVDISRPLSPTHDTESLFPTSGPLPAPSPPVSLSSLGFDIPSSIVASPPRESSSTTSPTLNVTPLSPTFSALSASRPPLAAGPLLSAAPISPTLTNVSDSLPPASPHQKPISLPPPLNAPTPLPPHLVGGSAARSRSRSRSREREKERSREKSSSRSRSRSGSREREDLSIEESEKPRSPRSPIASGAFGSAGMRLTGLEFAPKVHSPLASPPATEPGESSKVPESEEIEVAPSKEGELRAMAVEASSQDDTAAKVEEQAELPPPIPPPSTDPQFSSALGLPHLSIPVATSPVGDPEHLEESPTSRSSYFALAPGAALARSPPPLPDHLATLPAIPIHQHTSSWEDEFDEDDFDDLDHDGSGELGFSNVGRRKSSGTRAEEERVSILQALGITKSQAERDEERELSERAAEKRRIELEKRENERLDLLRKEEEERGQLKEHGSIGFMDIDLEAQGAAENDREEDDPGFGEAGDLSVGDLGDERLTIDEESLSALEKIFVCAKSEAVEERARVAHFLADWLPAVEICEAVEYVLPLLAGLIEDEMVKEVFAPQLDRIMWHFFSHCPLTELDERSDKEASTIEVAVPSRFPPRSDPLLENSPAPSLSGPSDRSTTPPPTSETSPAQSETSSSSNLPRISATTFTALLGALLTDQSTTVAKAAEAAIVRFLCRLKNKPIPPDSEISDFPPSDLLLYPSPEVTTVPALILDPHSTYNFSVEARQVLEDEVVSGIVVGLARLDEEDPERSTTINHGSEVHKTQVDQIKEEDEKEDPVLFSSPEENTIDFDEGDSDFDMKMLMEWTQSREREAREDSNIDVPPSSSPQDQIFSSFSPEQPADEESSIGKMVSMSLIGAIAAADCLESTVISKQFLPEVEKMKSESMFYVRKEAVQALGHLASVVSLEELEQTLLPLHTFFSKDQLWHVRRASVLALPSVCKRLPRPVLHEKAVEAIRLFSVDDNRNVRSGALEIAGELIYLFHEDPAGVPEELLAFFLGKPLNSNGDPSTSGQDLSTSSNQISHFQSALESPSSSFLDASNSWQSPGFFSRSTRDADRSILTAFNFPAVVLTLGGSKWDLLRDQHQALCKDPVEKARQSLASSLHEVAKIIGPDQADTSLFVPLADFLQDVENVQSAVLENIPTLFKSFGSETARKAVRLLGDAWSDIGNWRLREHALKKVAEFGPYFMQNGGEEEVLLILAKAFKDSVASVREQAVVAIPPLLNSVLEQPPARAKLFAFLSVFRTDSSYRNRVAYVSTVVACVRASLPRSTFELHFLDTLVDLARDKVVSVRIAVARAISEACRDPALYSDPSTRAALREILSILADSPDRDVRLPVLDYYVASPSPTSESSPLSPLKTRQNRNSFGVNVEDFPEVSAQIEHDEDSHMNEEEENEQGRRDDVDMEESPSSTPFESDGVLLERPSTSSGDLLTREEGDFVEVTRT